MDDIKNRKLNDIKYFYRYICMSIALFKPFRTERNGMEKLFTSLYVIRGLFPLDKKKKEKKKKERKNEKKFGRFEQNIEEFKWYRVTLLYWN